MQRQKATRAKCAPIDPMIARSRPGETTLIGCSRPVSVANRREVQFSDSSLLIIRAERFMSIQPNPTAVLFSGGRDSSLVACLLANQGIPVHLLTCNNGVSIGSELAEYRFNELRQAFGNGIAIRQVVSTMGLFRRIALANIETDFATYQKNLIVLGSQLAIHAEAVVYCLLNNLNCVASGFTAYQGSFAEQMPDSISMIARFMADFGIEYITPISGYSSCDEVKFGLLDFGISTKSLESVSIFADTFTEPSAEQVLRYIQEKLPICREYIELKTARLISGGGK